MLFPGKSLAIPGGSCKSFTILLVVQLFPIYVKEDKGRRFRYAVESADAEAGGTGSAQGQCEQVTDEEHGHCTP